MEARKQQSRREGCAAVVTDKKLIGMTVGDGTWQKILRRRSYLSGRVSYASADFELASRAGMLMAKVMGKRSPYRPFWSKANRVHIVNCGSKHFVEMLNGVLKRLESLIRQYPIRFLRGINNAEGCVTVRLRKGRLYPRIYLTNSDPEIVQLTRKLLKSVGIGTTLEINTRSGKRKTILGVESATRSDVYNICIGTARTSLRSLVLSVSE